MMKESALSSTFQWMGSLMFIQFISRLFHFFLNLVIVRFITPEYFGMSDLQLPFISTAITRVYKETVHRFALRSNSAQNLALVWWGVPLCICASGILGFAFMFSSKDLQNNPWMMQGLMCWMVAGWLEIAIEPALIHFERELLMKVIIAVECTSLAIQSLVTVALLLSFESVQLVPSYGHLCYSLSLFFGYYGYLIHQSPSLQQILPKSFKISNLDSIRGFFIQSLGKFVSAEGETAILFFFATPVQQGFYKFVFNLGSIVARIAFLSIEKTGCVIFSKLSKDDKERHRIWKMLLNVSFMISFLYLSTCPAYIHFAIDLVYGTKWSSTQAPDLLAFYGIYLLLIGVNGLVEAMRDAVAPEKKIADQAGFTFFSVVFYLCLGSLCMFYFGTAGIILAGCISTIVRCSFTIHFFKGYLFSIWDGFPESSTLLVFALIFLTSMASRFLLGDTWLHAGFGAFQGSGILVWLLYFQRKKLIETWTLVRKKQQ